MRLDRNAMVRTAAPWATGAAGLVALWMLLARLLYSDRGLDLTDEGLYLLAADPPSKTAAWVVPFGWHTKWLFALVGHDIAHFRTAGAVIVVVVGARAGRATVRRADSEGRPSPWTDAAGVITGGVSSLLIMAGLLRTPGYNWVNLVGLLIATAAALGTEWSSVGDRPWRKRAFLAGTAGIAFGAFVSVVAKPTSGPGIVVVALLLITALAGLRTAARAATAVVSWGIAFVLIAVVVGLWPTSFLSVFREATRFPVPSDSQTLGTAARDALHFPQTFWEAFGEEPTATQALVLLAVLSAAGAIATRGRVKALMMAPVVLCGVAAVGISLPLAHVGQPEPKGRFAWQGTSVWLWVLVLGALLHAVATDIVARKARRGLWSSGAFLVAAAILFGLGSGHGTFRQTGLGGGLVVLVALAFTADRRSGVRMVALPVVAAVAVVGTAATLSASTSRPYRTEPVDALVTPVEISIHRSPLLVDDGLAEFLGGSRAAARDAGFCEGTKLLGFVWRWSSTVPFHLGARVPESLMITLFGYPNSVDIALHTLSTLDASWRGAWILVSDPSTLEPEQRDTVAAAMAHLGVLGRSFPEDYQLASAFGDLQLWRPVDAPDATCPT